MKKIILLSLAAAALLCGCTHTRTYKWNDVSLTYDSSRYSMADLDEGYGVNFTMLDNAKPGGFAQFTFFGETDFLYMGPDGLGEMYESDIRSKWEEVCVQDSDFEASWGSGGYITYSLDPDLAAGGLFLPYDGTRDGNPVWGVIAADSKGLYEALMWAECGSEASRDAFLELFKGIVYPPAEDGMPAGGAGEEDFYEDYTWDAVSLNDEISLMFDYMDYFCEVVDDSDGELVFRLEPTWEEAEGAFARIRFEMADRDLDTGSDAWEETLQDALDPLMTSLDKDKDFQLDGRFSPWYKLDAGYGEYIRYMGTRLSDDRFIEGAFAAKGYQKGRALMQAEAADEETLMTLIDLFSTVEFEF
ncbi:MAG: hypothetical protein GXY24_06740 [Bacteroidales bacterium]|jgi:hypothetical protein|nr:hypothetical protein [Bacteroidales bacterium]